MQREAVREDSRRQSGDFVSKSKGWQGGESLAKSLVIQGLPSVFTVSGGGSVFVILHHLKYLVHPDNRLLEINACTQLDNPSSVLRIRNVCAVFGTGACNYPESRICESSVRNSPLRTIEQIKEFGHKP